MSVHKFLALWLWSRGRSRSRSSNSQVSSSYSRSNTCLSGGGKSGTLPHAQSTVQLPEAVHLQVVPGDGDCLYHCLLMASHDQKGGGRRDTSAWTIAGLRSIAGNASGDATGEHIQALATALQICFKIVPASIEQCILQWEACFVLGDPLMPEVTIVWWHRAEGDQVVGVHFDLLVRQEAQALAEESFHTLRAQLRTSNLRAYKHYKRLHMVSVLSPSVLPPGCAASSTL
eukprot:6459203-Amphidinium_carterae.1